MTDIFLAWASDIETRLRIATTGNKPEEVRKLSFAVQKANMVLESWLLTSGGKLVGYEGQVGTASISPERLGELPRLREQYETAVEGRCFMGVGTELSEARMALDVAKGRGGSHSIVFYTEDVAEEAHALQQQQAAEQGDSFGLTDDDAASLEEPLGKSFGAEPSAGEATQIANGAVSPSAAQPSPLPMAGASALPSAGPSEMQESQEGQGGEQPPQQAGGQAPPASDKLKKEIVSVLRDIRAQTPTFEKLKEENPDAYEAVMNLVEAMLGMAKQILGVQPGQSMSKSEDSLEKSEKAVSVCQHCKKKVAVRIKDDRGSSAQHDCDGGSFTVGFTPGRNGSPTTVRWLDNKTGKDTVHKGELEAAETGPEDGAPVDDKELQKDALSSHPAPSAHHHLQLPTGSVHNGRVRVVHQDGQTQWVSVRAGQISVDNHTKSSRAPDDHHVASGEEANNPLEAQARQGQ